MCQVKANIIKAEFDVHANEYENELNRWLNQRFGTSKTYVNRAKAQELITLLKLNKDSNALGKLLCLDVGCGTGAIASYLCQNNIKTIGVDLSYHMIQSGQKCAPNQAQCIVSPSTRLPFESGFFDCCYTVCLFHHLSEPDQIKTLREMKRVTKRGGLVTIFEHNPYNPVSQLIVKLSPLDKNVRLLTKSKVNQLFSETGIQTVLQKYILFFPEFMSKLNYLETYMNQWPMGCQYLV
ncbi:MAG: hypothetical protein A3E74_03985, partial [Omnitrophica bacterium RIFCSPHIGHO2_12_FULL_44_12]